IRRLPPLPSSAHAIRPFLPAASPASHSPAPADAADYFGTSRHKNAHPRSASNVPAPRLASSARVGLPRSMILCGAGASPANAIHLEISQGRSRSSEGKTLYSSRSENSPILPELLSLVCDG